MKLFSRVLHFPLSLMITSRCTRRHYEVLLETKQSNYDNRSSNRLTWGKKKKQNTLLVLTSAYDSKVRFAPKPNNRVFNFRTELVFNADCGSTPS